MNLTNDNADGCRQIAAAGGLHSIASLLVVRCPAPRTGHQVSIADGNSARGAPGAGEVRKKDVKAGPRTNGGVTGMSDDGQLAEGPKDGLGVEASSEAALIGPNPTAQGGNVGSGVVGRGKPGAQSRRGRQGAAAEEVPFAADVSRRDDVSVESGNGTGQEIVKLGEGPSEDLDLVTVVLALLINLVEKDRENRAALAALEFPRGGGQAGEPLEAAGMVTFLCALFLSKKGAGAKAESVENQMAAFEVRY